MTPRWRRRLLTTLWLMAGIGGVAFLLIRAFSENMTFYYSPTQVQRGEAPQARVFRLGGLVETGSVRREAGTLKVYFRLTDGRATVPVVYEGILPDLFREGQGILARGRWDGQRFVAEEVLAKHDETYMPPEVADSLKAASEAP